MKLKLLFVPILVAALSGCIVVTSSGNNAPSSPTAPLQPFTLVYSTLNAGAHEVHRFNTASATDAMLSSGWNPRVSSDGAKIISASGSVETLAFRR